MVKIFKVGGAVRDEFLGVKSKDIDFAVEATSFDEMRDFIAAKGKIFLEKPEFLTIRAKVNNEDADFVLCRKEGTYTDGRRPDSVEIGTIFDDLARRDFTMNAIAQDMNGKFIDPFNGVADIQKREINSVGKAVDRFSEDSLRMLRAVRFSITKNFTMSNEIVETFDNDDLLSKLSNVSKERIREELNKCFMSNTLVTLEMFERFPKFRNTIFNVQKLHLEARTQ